MDTYEPLDTAEMDSLLAGVRRLTHLADSASEPREIFRELAAELFAELSVEEVQVHHISEREDMVAVYMFGGEGSLSYLMPPGERPHGVAWVVGTGQHVAVNGARELIASMPRLAAGGGVVGALLLPVAVRGDVEAVVVLVRRRDGVASGGGSDGRAGDLQRAALGRLRAGQAAGGAAAGLSRVGRRIPSTSVPCNGPPLLSTRPRPPWPSCAHAPRPAPTRSPAA